MPLKHAPFSQSPSGNFGPSSLGSSTELFNGGPSGGDSIAVGPLTMVGSCCK